MSHDWIEGGGLPVERSALHEALDAHVAVLTALGSGIAKNLLPPADRAEVERLFRQHEISVHPDVYDLYAWSAGQIDPEWGPDLFYEGAFYPVELMIEDVYLPSNRPLLYDEEGEEEGVPFWETDALAAYEFPVIGPRTCPERYPVRICNFPFDPGSVWMGFGEDEDHPRYRCFDSFDQAVRVFTYCVEMGWYRVDGEGQITGDRRWAVNSTDLRFPPYYNGDGSDL